MTSQSPPKCSSHVGNSGSKSAFLFLLLVKIFAKEKQGVKRGSVLNSRANQLELGGLRLAAEISLRITESSTRGLKGVVFRRI